MVMMVVSLLLFLLLLLLFFLLLLLLVFRGFLNRKPINSWFNLVSRLIKTERERCVRARWTETEQTDRLESRRLNKVWALFFLREKKCVKGVCSAAKLAILCISISPTTGWATGQTENTRCVNHALITFVPLKWICVNALNLTALNYLIKKVFFFNCIHLQLITQK